jgi:transcriptional regulator with XRE-family HTH domain
MKITMKPIHTDNVTELAKKAGLAYSYTHQLTRGLRNPTVKTLVRLLYANGKTAQEIRSMTLSDIATIEE